MISFSTSSFSQRPGATIAGIFSLALSSIVLLCGAGLTPTGTVQKADINANGYNLTNAATVSATNVIVSGSLTAPAGFTLPFAKITGPPTTLAGYGIHRPGGADERELREPGLDHEFRLLEADRDAGARDRGHLGFL